MRGLIGGFLVGVALLALVALGATLLAPPPPAPGSAASDAGTPPRLDQAARPDSTPRRPDRPDGQADKTGAATPATGGVEIPAGSQFNRPGEDRPTDTADAATPPAPPAATPPPPAGAGAAAPPAPDTTPALRPEAATDTPGTLPNPNAGDAPARRPVTATGTQRPAIPGTAPPPAPAGEDSPEVPAAAPAPGSGKDGAAGIASDGGAEAGARDAPAAPSDGAGQTAPIGTAAPTEEAPPTLPEETPPAVLRIPAPSAGPALPGRRVAPLPGLDAQQTAAPAPRLGALARHAAPFDAPAATPLMALLLGDPGEDATARETLTTFPFPVSFAVAPEAADAEAAMRRYREAGFEVVMAPGALPPGGRAADIETALESWRIRLPATVAVLAPPPGGSGAARRAQLEAVAAILDAEGRGLIGGDSELSMAIQVARGAGVPAVPIAARLPAGGDQQALLAALDKAAFEARRRGAVIVAAEGSMATARALFTWAARDRQTELRLAPVSAVLRRAGGG